VGVASLAARHVEQARTGGQREDLDQPRDLATVAREVEDRFVLEEVMGVEVRLPPFARLSRRAQKKTGSR
jgi:hypothetical protein